MSFLRDSSVSHLPFYHCIDAGVHLISVQISMQYLLKLRHSRPSENKNRILTKTVRLAFGGGSILLNELKRVKSNIFILFGYLLGYAYQLS